MNQLFKATLNHYITRSQITDNKITQSLYRLMSNLNPQSSILILLLLCLSPFSSMAQTWNWGIKGGSSTAGQSGSAIENIVDMTTDQNGNVYFVALVKGPGATLGNTNIPLTYYGGADILLAKYDCEGNYKWHKSFGGYSEYDKAIAIGVDTLGGVYVIGRVYSPGNTSTRVSFDTDTTLAYGTGKSVFIVKYDTSGTFQWLRMPEPDSTTSSVRNSWPMDLIVEQNGNFQVLLASNGGLMAPGNIVLPEYGTYLLKYNNQGDLSSYTQLQMQTNFALLPRVAQDKQNGNYYVAGAFDTSYTGDFLFMGSHEITGSMIVGAFDSLGQYLWHRTNVNPSVGFFGRPQIDGQGNITLLGVIVRASLPYQIPDTFNGYVSEIVPGYYSQSPFVVQLSPTGTNNWALGSLTSSGLRFKGITILGNEFIVGGPLTGSPSLIGKFFWEGMTDTIKYTGNHLTLHRINASSGAFIDTFPSLDMHTPAPISSEFSILTKDKSNNLYVGGAFNSQQLTFPNGTLMSEGPTDFFVARYGYDCNCDAPTASYTHSANGNNTVSFSYTGTTPYTSISWDFGDGSNSTSANPTHTYAASGSFNACVTVVNDCGTDTYCQTVNASGVGIRENGLAAQVAIYPNPTKGSLMIKGLQGVTRYHLYNGVGQSIRQGSLHGNHAELDISKLASGWFVLELQDEQGGKGRFKVVKE